MGEGEGAAEKGCLESADPVATHLKHTSNDQELERLLLPEMTDLIGRHSSILVDPFSSLHHQWVALDIVWMIISPRSSHSFRVLVVWNDVVVIREVFVADGAYSALLENLST
jgi:hypothetical protein